MNRPSNAWMTLAALAATATTTASCAILVGFDKDYQEVTNAGAGGASASSTGSTVGTTGSASNAAVSTSVAATGVGGGSSVTTTGAGGAYVGPPSCAGLPATCGATGKEDCCAHPQVMGGIFNRENDPQRPATVSSFYLDRFEVTVGRFRRFADAYPGGKPAAGAGANPKVSNSGWNASWNTSLPTDEKALVNAITTQCVATEQGSLHTTWTLKPDPSGDKLPINCVSWFVAFAFCAWDGGRLPSEVEWNYAAAGGSEQRLFPWTGTELDAAHASFNCLGDPDGQCGASDIFPVGATSPLGDGKWQQADLGGNMFEWVLDNWSFEHPLPCADCAVLNNDDRRVRRGGSWWNIGEAVKTEFRDRPAGAGVRWDESGFRCARDNP
jgi:formylglycine-generating enzyme